MRQNQDTQKRSNLKSFIIIGLLLLLVAVIGFGGYTLSKYLTSKSEKGSASVAKWGFTVETNATKLFGTNYKFDTNNSIVTADTANLTVKASDENNRVAPGTTGSMTFSIKGSAEVKANIKIEMSDVSDIVLKYTKNGTAQEDYAPVKWTLKKGSETIVNGGTLADVSMELNKVNATYEAGATEINDEYTLSWAWAFEGNDAADTLLGMIANDANTTANGDYTKAEGTSTTISFTLKISVTQLAK